MSKASAKAIKAIKPISMAITLRDIFKPSDAPWEIASKRFAWVFFTSNLIAPLVGDSSVSGQTILEITKAHLKLTKALVFHLASEWLIQSQQAI